jgi:translation initiation factor 2B subunit (eIF-2B alpha/beta/delta family)
MSKDNLVRKLLQQRNAIEDKLIAQDSSMLSVPELLMKHKALSRRYKSSKTNFTDQITDAQKRMMDQIDEIEKMVQRINLSHFKPNDRVNAGDEELLKYANDFLDLAPEEQKNLFIGDVWVR